MTVVVNTADYRALTKPLYGHCNGCLMIADNLPVDGRQDPLTAVEYLSYFTTNATRYIISLRNPTDRTISHYFYRLQRVSRLLHIKILVSVFSLATKHLGGGLMLW